MIQVPAVMLCMICITCAMIFHESSMSQLSTIIIKSLNPSSIFSHFTSVNPFCTPADHMTAMAGWCLVDSLAVPCRTSAKSEERRAPASSAVPFFPTKHTGLDQLGPLKVPPTTHLGRSRCTVKFGIVVQCSTMYAWSVILFEVWKETCLLCRTDLFQT